MKKNMRFALVAALSLASMIIFPSLEASAGLFCRHRCRSAIYCYVICNQPTTSTCATPKKQSNKPRASASNHPRDAKREMPRKEDLPKISDVPPETPDLKIPDTLSAAL